MTDGVLISTPELLAAVSLAMQAMALEIEIQGGPKRGDIANRIKRSASDGKFPGLDESIRQISVAIEADPQPPSLRLV